MSLSEDIPEHFRMHHLFYNLGLTVNALAAVYQELDYKEVVLAPSSAVIVTLVTLYLWSESFDIIPTFSSQLHNYVLSYQE